MKDPRHRELMSELYRLWERYESPPINDMEQLKTFFEKLGKELNVMHEKFGDDPVCFALMVGLLDGLSAIPPKEGDNVA